MGTRQATAVTVLGLAALAMAGPGAWRSRAFAAQQPPLSGEQHRGEVRALAAGKLLIASRALRDPNFVQTVVLLVDFTGEGAVGLVLNRQSDVPISRAFTGPEGLRGGRSYLFVGGPVEVRGILGLVRGPVAGLAHRHVVKDVYLVNSRESLEQVLAAGTSPDRCRIYAGYSGWGAAQLQREVIAGAWSVLDGTGGIAFDPDPDTLWDRLVKLTGGLNVRRDDGAATGAVGLTAQGRPSADSGTRGASRAR